MIANVKIEQDKENSMIHRVYLDGKEIKRIEAVDFGVSSEFPVPEVNIKITGGCDFEGMADIRFDYSPYTVKEACKILREELLKHKDFYRAFELSMYSALKEMPKEIRMGDMCMNEAVNRILKRIIGEE